MAKNNEVDLVIRARNEASKTLKAIVAAFDEFKGSTDKFATSANKANTPAAKLESTLAELNRTAAGMKALSTMSENMAEATAAAEKLDAGVKKDAAELARMAREAEQATQRANQLRGRFEAEQATLASLNKERAEANKLLAKSGELSRAVNRADRNQTAYAAGTTQKQARTTGVGLDIGTAQSSARDSAAAFIAADVEQSRAALAAAQAVVKSYDEQIARVTADIQQLSPAVDAATAHEKNLTAEAKKQNTTLQQSREALTNVRGELVQMRDAMQQAEAVIGQHIVSQAKVSDAYDKTAAEIERVTKLATAMSRFSTGTGGFSDPKTAAGLQAQATAVENARATWKTLEAEVRRVAVEMKASGTASDEQKASFYTTIAAARAAKAEYQQQAAALEKLTAASNQQTAAEVRLQAAARRHSYQTQEATTATAAVDRLSSSTFTLGAQSQQATGKVDSLGKSFRGLFADSRESLSLFQRIRGELLALGASYVGIYGIQDKLAGVVDASNKAEAAVSRLNVAFKGDKGAATNEYAWLEREADRLGIAINTLSTEYSKFAISAQSANFTGKTTRDVFMAISEAGVVQRLSVSQLEGVFKALGQMLDKGKIQAEELRGQLGDRLTGAFKLFADAIGVSTGELDNMLKKGEVFASEETMSKVGERLRAIYGSELANALASTTAEMGRFQNHMTQAQILVGQGGFMAAFNDALKQANDYLASREGRDFFLSLGAAIGKATSFAVGFVDIMNDFSSVIGIIIAARLATWVLDAATRFAGMAKEAGVANTAFFSFYTNLDLMKAKWTSLVATLGIGTQAINGMGTTLNTLGLAVKLVGVRAVATQVLLNGLSVVVGALAGAFRLLWSAIGGLPGLILTGITYALSSWLFSVNDTTSALDEHKRIMGEVLKAYDAAKGKTDEWAKGIKNVTVDQLNSNIRKLAEQYDTLKGNVTGGFGSMVVPFKFWDSGARDAASAINTLNSQFKANEITVTQYRQKLEDLYKGNVSQTAREYIEDKLKEARQLEEVAKALDLNTEAGKAQGQTYEWLGQRVGQTGATLQKAAEASNTATNAEEQQRETTKKLRDAMEALSKPIQTVADDLKRLETIDGLNKQYQDAMKLARTMGEVQALTERYNRAMAAVATKDIKGISNDFSAAAFQMISRFEGYDAVGKPDYTIRNGQTVNAGTIGGYGSDTVTLADGSIQKITEGMKVSREDADRDLERRLPSIQSSITDQIGVDRFNSFSAQQQGVLASLSYNYGDLSRTGIVDTIKNGTVEEIADAIRSLASHNGGINQNRRYQEAEVFQNGGSDVDLSGRVAANMKKAAEFHATLNRDLTYSENEVANAGKLTREMAIQKALEEARLKAKKDGTTLTATEEERVKKVAAAEWDAANAKKEAKKTQQSANQLLAEAQALYREREALRTQYNQQAGMGNTEAADATAVKLADTNTKLQEAIQKARQMWEAIGGSAAEAALAKLDALNAKVDTAKNKTNSFGLTSQQVTGYVDSFATGIANAFGSFAEAVVNGQNAFKAFGVAVLKTLAQVLQQIAVAIIRMQILKMLASFGGGIGSIATSLLGGVSHTGGSAGSSNRSRSLGLASVASPFVYHTGGLAGLKSNEIVSVLERGETIRTEEQEAALTEKQAAADRAAKGGQGIGTIRNIVTLDEDSAANFLGSSAGEKVVWSILGKNRGKLKGLVG